MIACLLRFKSLVPTAALDVAACDYEDYSNGMVRMNPLSDVCGPFE